MVLLHRCKLWDDYQELTSKNSSADRAPRVPPLKLSMKRTQFLSNGTVVPPEVTQAMGLLKVPAEGQLAQKCYLQEALYLGLLNTYGE